jgi:uncharacterized repeat protein (TIGR03803 family)
MKFKLFGIVMVVALASSNLSAQTFSVLHFFDQSKGTGFTYTNADGANSYAGFALSGNTLFGTTSLEGANGSGTIFSVSTDASDNFSLLHVCSTNYADGQNPSAILLLSGNLLFGTTYGGGTNRYGTVFSLNTNDDSFHVIHNFTNSPDGAYPYGVMVLLNNTFYGTTSQGGTNSYGTVFSMGTNGSNFKILHSFTNSPDGEYPLAGLVYSGGTLFGTTWRGGTKGYGTLFSLATNGAGFKVFHNFTNSPDGAYPQADLILSSSGGTIYGVTGSGGTNNNGMVFSVNTNGNNLINLHSFSAAYYNNSVGAYTNIDGAGPDAGMALAGDTLYGTAVGGGSGGNGTVFSISTNGNNFTLLHTFAASQQITGHLGFTIVVNADGANPEGDLLLSSNVLYGSTYNDGMGANGTVFSINLEPSLLVSNIVPNLDGSMNISFSGGANETYLVQAATNLTPPVNWRNISTNTADVNGFWEISDTDTKAYPIKFYRASTH